MYFLALDSRHLPGARPFRYFRLEPPLHSHNIKNDKGPKTLSLGSPQDAEIMEEFIKKNNAGELFFISSVISKPKQITIRMSAVEWLTRYTGTFVPRVNELRYMLNL